MDNSGQSNYGTLHLQNMDGRVDMAPAAKRKWRPLVEKQGLSTFGGVYVPCMISIIGVILFLRLGWAVGQAGVMGVLAMFGVGGFMALLTDLSLSAMATNGRVGDGGTYYLISRSVGPEFGGAIGLMFYAANTIGIAFYLQGFTDTMADKIGWDPDHDHWRKVALAVGVLGLETIVNITSAGLYTKCIFFVFVLQMLAIFYGNLALLVRGEVINVKEDIHLTGVSWETFKSNLWPDFDEDTDVLKVFGIIFPAMTGIMAGTNMSGVLRRPELSIPRGELSALASALLTYAILVLSFGACVDRHSLKTNTLILSDATWWPMGLTLGILVSTSSSALASIQSSSRLLQAVAMDRLVPPLAIFGRTIRGEPVLATLVSVVMAGATLMVGSLNAIAPVLTMFFLITYATTNFATFVHSIAGHPNFRPRFRWYTWHTALFGGLLCFALMVYLQWEATLVAFVLTVILAAYIARRAPVTDWGLVSQSLIFHQVRKYLLRLDDRQQHVKFWRPQILCLAHTPLGRVNVLEFVNELKKGGLFVIGDVLLPENGQRAIGREGYERFKHQRRQWQTFVDASRLKAFISVTAAASLRDGVTNLMMTAGLGGMQPNTLLLGFFNEHVQSGSGSDELLNSVYDPKAPNAIRQVPLQEWQEAGGGAQAVSESEYVNILLDAKAFGYNVLILRNFSSLHYLEVMGERPPQWSRTTAPAPRDHRHEDPNFRSIDVWEVPWGNLESLSLSLQLAAVLHDSDPWNRFTYIRVCALVEADDAELNQTHATFARLHKQVVRESRIRATIHVFILADDDEELYQLARNEAQAAAGGGKKPETERSPTPPLTRTDTEPFFSASRWRGGGSTTTGTTEPRAEMGVFEQLPHHRAAEIVHTFISRHKSGSAVTFLPLPLAAEHQGQTTVSDQEAVEYVGHLSRITGDLGPLVLVSGVQRVIATDL